DIDDAHQFRPAHCETGEIRSSLLDQVERCTMTARLFIRDDAPRNAASFALDEFGLSEGDEIRAAERTAAAGFDRLARVWPIDQAERAKIEGHPKALAPLNDFPFLPRGALQNARERGKAGKKRGGGFK